jgi:DNA-binding LacI/PurR family transcriptional regulator
VRLDFAEIGRRLVERLLELIHHRPLQPQPPVRPELVVRASSAAPQ